MVAPTIIAIFLLLLRPLGELEGVGEVDAWVGVGMMALELLVVGDDEVGAVVGVEKVAGEEPAEESVAWGVVTENMLIADVARLAVVGFDVALDAVVPPPSCELVYNTGVCPLFSTTLKLLLMKVGKDELEVLRSDTSKWHIQAFPSSRGTRMEPVAGTEWLYG